MKITVVGLGYVGLPLALELQKHFEVVGVDKNSERLKDLMDSYDYNEEHGKSEFGDNKIQYLDTVNSDSDVYIVTVPTPVDRKFTPDLSYVIHAADEIGDVAPENAIVVLESTVAPGTTNGVFRDAICANRRNKKIHVAYSPERINPGDKINTLKNVVKVVGASDKEVRDILLSIYEKVSKSVYLVDTCEAAECAKIFENTQRDVNIALMNEFAKIADAHDISIFDVAGAMDTKWNALKFKPGLVGGHCISVDPYYLIEQAQKMNIPLSVINNARNLNESLPSRYTRKIVSIFNRVTSSKILNAKVLIVGASFKPGVSDVRNSKAIDLAKEFSGLRCDVTLYDELVDYDKFDHEFTHLTGAPLPSHVRITDDVTGAKFDIIVTFSGTETDPNFYTNLLSKEGIIYDLQGIVKSMCGTKRYYSP